MIVTPIFGEGPLLAQSCRSPKGMSGSGVAERQAGRSFDVRFVHIALKN
jgi:hypothetical protein